MCNSGNGQFVSPETQSVIFMGINTITIGFVLDNYIVTEHC